MFDLVGLGWVWCWLVEVGFGWLKMLGFRLVDLVSSGWVWCRLGSVFVGLGWLKIVWFGWLRFGLVLVG